MTDFVARPHMGRMLLLLLLSAGFVLLGLWIAGFLGEVPDPGKEWAGWLSIVFFGFCAVVIATRLFDKEDQVRIGSLGIYSKQWSPDTIPWSEIADVSVWEYQKQKSIVLHLKDPAKFPSKTMMSKLAAANRALTGGDVAITLSGTDGKFDQAMAAIAHFRR